jgi:D-glycero-D-manno-heptose 1,7-bisphosphate phosphatase
MTIFQHAILDRDGVLNIQAPGGYVLKPDQWHWEPGALEGLAELARAGIRISVATNQSCVGRGLMDLDGLEKIHGLMKMQAAKYGVSFSGIYFCPHAPDQGCACRKPLPGLLEQAIDESGIPAEQTLFIGDSETDLLAARAAGITAWLVRTGKGMETEEAFRKENKNVFCLAGFQVFNNLKDAAQTIVFCRNKGKKD